MRHSALAVLRFGVGDRSFAGDHASGTTHVRQLGGRLMTIKRITLLKRKRDMSPEEFAAHWAGPHAEIARHLPGLVRYNQNHVLAASITGPDGEWPIDGFVELWFRDQASVEEAARSDVTRALISDEPSFLDGLTGLAVNVSPLADGAPCKVIVAGRPVDGENPAPGIDELHAELAASRGFVCGLVDCVGDIMRRDGLWSDPRPPQRIGWAGFDTLRAAQAAFERCCAPARLRTPPECYLAKEIRII
jgi:uncharacterized protein (TIGR02118 family)